MDFLALILPFLSVLLGAAITYGFSVRTNRKSKVDDVFHDAIAAVAEASASVDYTARLSWGGSTPQDESELAGELGRQHAKDHVAAVARARAAIARASAYDAGLTPYYKSLDAVYKRSDEIMDRLRKRL